VDKGTVTLSHPPNLIKRLFEKPHLAIFSLASTIASIVNIWANCSIAFSEDNHSLSSLPFNPPFINEAQYF